MDKNDESRRLGLEARSRRRPMIAERSNKVLIRQLSVRYLLSSLFQSEAQLQVKYSLLWLIKEFFGLPRDLRAPNDFWC